MKLAERIRNLFTSGSLSDEAFDDLEDLLIEGDVGVKLTVEVVDELRGMRSLRNGSKESLIEALKSLLEPYARAHVLEVDPEKMTFILVLGVNGVGKTTAIARLAKHYQQVLSEDQIVLCAGDTFRAAAVDQLSVHADRLGVRIVKQGQGADAGAVIFDAIDSGRSRDARLILADTAGRMHNKRELVAELSKIDRIIQSKAADAVYHKMLVIDATTGQNGLRQAEVFRDAIGVDSIFIAKYDSSGKGGTALTIARELEIPVSFVGTGETYDAIERFDPERYLTGLFE